MKKKIKKVVKLNLKNAIVIRTNVIPFKITKGSIADFVRCSKGIGSNSRTSGSFI